ncbi:hypothetical protein LTR62_006134 [Meristemomyces frigidus]|uniref:Uncharacterized protein n=1 Tax=Meristemomyces frigidus TaxID=1508187 RepID=A0AAN7TDX1_9PEZI|nr:hypothetical protein LTR62_006134 [Meristemomyces frigidus]
MPKAIPSFNDGVSVFHFTNRVSAAKIAKYENASRRGMINPGLAHVQGGHNRLPTPAPQIAPAGTLHLSGSADADSLDPSSMEPPSKKARRKLAVRDSAQSPAGTPGGTSNTPVVLDAPNETIAVARPVKPPRPVRWRYDDMMVLDDETLRIHSDSSDSELESPPRRSLAHMKQTMPVPVAPEKPANPEYGDFMSYYVTGGDDEEDKANVNGAQPSANGHGTTQQHAAQAQHAQTQHRCQQNPLQQQRPPPRPRKQQMKMPPPPPPPPVPTIHLLGFDIVNKPYDENDPKTVAKMIEGLQALSASLEKFAGVPPPQSPPHNQKTMSMPVRVSEKQEAKKQEAKKQQPKKQDAAIEDFLGMFEDEDEDSSDVEAASTTNNSNLRKRDDEDERVPNLNYLLERPGASDGPLTYGIQFIQNALRSWAQQRLTREYHDQRQYNYQTRMQQYYQPQKRGPGRPRKFIDENEERMLHQLALQPVVVEAPSTDEGKAVQCFREVISSGCLQVNAVLPHELTRALRNLYMQIDRLINQGTKNDPEWHCMSYGAQIAGHKLRVEKWKEAQTNARAEMARQQQFSQQQGLHQIGFSAGQHQHPTEEQMRRNHEMDLERRRSVAHAQQQPYLSQHHLNPLLLGSQPPGTPAGFAPSPGPSPASAGMNQSPAHKPSTPNTNIPPRNGQPSTASPAHASGEHPKQHMDHVVLYQAGYQPPRGAQMKFSFAPSNEQQMQVWGSNAFPQASPSNATVPNRGPMAPSPTRASQGKALNSIGNGAAHPAIVPSIETNGRRKSGSAQPKHAQKKRKADSTMAEAMALPVQGSGARSDPVIIKKEHTKSPPPSAPPASLPASSSGFTAVNQPAPVPPKSLDAVPAAVNAKTNGHNGMRALAARYPHPGAVVVDQ